MHTWACATATSLEDVSVKVYDYSSKAQPVSEPG